MCKIVIVKEKRIQGYSLRQRYSRPSADSILTETKFLVFLVSNFRTLISL